MVDPKAIRTERVRTAHDLVSAAIFSSNTFQSRPWFRGSADASWELSPSLFRKRADGWLPPDIGVYERTITNDFLRFAPSRRANVPPRTQVPEWLCLMRHYGLPTRILDWSTSVLVAGYFAVIERPDACADIWALDVCGLNGDAVGKPEHLSLMGDDDAVRALARYPFTGGTLPDVPAVGVIVPEIDTRMLLQQSCFTLHSTGAALEALPVMATRLIRFHIDKGDKGEIAAQLGMLGFSRMTLFPDLDSVTSTIASWRYGSSKGGVVE